MIRRVLSITFLLALPIASVFAQQKPDFSGTWILNVAQSEFGILGGPSRRTDVIIHKGPSLSDNITAVTLQGKQELKHNYTTDGKEAVNKLGTVDIKSIVKWVGRNLLISSKYVINSANVSSETTWTLSPDGNTLTMSTRFKGNLGDTSQKLVFEKQVASGSTD